MPWYSDFEYLMLIAIAAGLGALIGVEREFANKPAGLRTHTIVAAASALLMILGNLIVDSFQQNQAASTISADPIRIMQAIVVGISFLGGGTIIHDKGNNVEGLTTAASILLTSGIGIAVAMGNIILAIGVTLGALMVLFFVGQIERVFHQWREKSEVENEPKGNRS